MKTRNFTLPIFTFIAGIFVGISIIGILSFSSASAPVIPAGVKNVTTKSAYTAIVTYFGGTFPREANKSFCIDKIQLNALNYILERNPRLDGFRLYIGKSERSTALGIVVGTKLFNGVQRDLITSSDSVYMMDAPHSGPCPDVCDGNSLIVQPQ